MCVYVWKNITDARPWEMTPQVSRSPTTSLKPQRIAHKGKQSRNSNLRDLPSQEAHMTALCINSNQFFSKFPPEIISEGYM